MADAPVADPTVDTEDRSTGMGPEGAAGGPRNAPHITVRAVAVGVAFGGLLCGSNMYFGLQTGWITMGSLQASLVGFAAFRGLRPVLRGLPLTPVEHVVLQSTAVATATLPLAAGFVGILPALAMLTPEDSPTGPLRLSATQQLLWAGSLAFFGAFFAVPLRRQLILRERLRFPSGTATARMIQVLHGLPCAEPGTPAGADEAYNAMPDKEDAPPDVTAFGRQMKCLWAAFAVGSIYQLLTLPLPAIGGLPIFTWVGLSALTEWRWTLNLSPGYVGQGLIMGPRTTLSMLLGAVLGWGVLGPVARGLGWAPGPVGSLADGGSGWILWVALALMIGESVTDLALLAGVTVLRRYSAVLRRSTDGAVTDPAPAAHRVPTAWWAGGLAASSALCVAGIRFVVPDESLAVLAAAVVASLVCAGLAVRALGETDLNPVSGIGKVAQLLFALLAPGHVVTNLVAGAIAEAGATQAGDLMQDLKCGHLVGASPRAQFYGQLIGSLCSVFFTVGAYQLFDRVYVIGQPPFQAPTAAVWLEMARILNGAPPAHHVAPFCIALGALGAASAVHGKLWPRLHSRLPSAMAVAVGMYIAPNWTLPRVAGGLVEWLWRRRAPDSHARYCIVAASGFVLGEGMSAIVVCIIKAALL